MMKRSSIFIDNSDEFEEIASNKKDDSKVVNVEIENLNIRNGAGYEYPITGQYTGIGSFLITEEENGFGKLADGSGWICLKFTK